MMRVLYSPIGDTDPIRGCYDGAMLHIVRHYKPRIVILFLSQDMTQKESEMHLYTRSIHSIDESIEVQLINTHLVDVHKIDTLIPLADEFYKIREIYKDAELILNLSSGTPQMKEIMSYLAVEHGDVIGVQVDSPQRGSNRSEFALQGNEDIETVIESNLDNEPDSPVRCHEPKLAYLKRNQLKHSLIHALQIYDYHTAQSLFNSYKHTLPDSAVMELNVLPLLQHADMRLKLNYKAALSKCSRCGGDSLSSVYTDKDIQLLDEFLMVMEVRLKQKQYEDFILKITPFMYTLMRWYLSRLYKFDWKKVEKKTNQGTKIDMGLLKTLQPGIYKSWSCHNTSYPRDLIQLSLYHMLDMIRDDEQIPSTLFSQIEQIRKIERKIRNKLAHEIIIFSEHDICKHIGIQSLHHFFQQLKLVFHSIIGKDKVRQKLVYDTINEYVIGKLQ